MTLLRQSLIARLIARRAWRMIAALVALIMAIFLTDIFTSELEAVIKNGGHFGDFLWLMLLKIPNVVDFALPIVLFLGLFFAIQGARADNELMICAAAGEPWHQVPRTAMMFGLGALVVSLIFSGLIVPASSYALRLSFHELVSRQFIDRLTTPQVQLTVQDIGGRVVIAAPVEGAERGRLFVYSDVPDAPGRWRVALARDWTARGPDEAGAYQLDLQGFRELAGRYDQGQSAPSDVQAPSLSASTLRVEELTLDFRLDDVLEAADAERLAGERFLFQEGGVFDDAVPTRALGEMLARALLALVAAALAVAAAAFAGLRGGRWTALPLGLVLVMVADIASRAILGDAASLGFVRFWIAFAALAALGLVPALGFVWLRAETIVTPPRATSA